jgi:catechol 2,3-dioxygenase-like lactoylglutathione lyase family enzyme
VRFGNGSDNRFMNQSIGQLAIVVREYDEAIDFYVETLGFRLIEDTPVFVREPSEETYGTVAVFKDLYGNLWDLIQLRNPE